MSVNAIPAGFHTVTPYLMVKDAARIADFLKRAFLAEETSRTCDEAGGIRHMELRIGNSMVMMSEERGEWKAMPASLYLYVENVDEVYARALAAGGESLMAPADQFYGDRNAGVKDASGNIWWLGTHIEDVSAEEIERRMRAMGGH